MVNGKGGVWTLVKSDFHEKLVPFLVRYLPDLLRLCPRGYRVNVFKAVLKRDRILMKDETPQKIQI